MDPNQTVETETAAPEESLKELPEAEGGEASPDTEGAEGGFTDTESGTEGTESGKAKQTASENAKNAQRRREAESSKLEKAKEEAILMVLKNKNPYTGEEMKDSEDVREYLAMREKQEAEKRHPFLKS